MKTEAQKRAQMKYLKEKTIKKSVTFQKTTDADIIEYVQNVGNFQAYVKELIREDINRRAE